MLLDFGFSQKEKKKKEKKNTVFYDSVPSARVIKLLQACPQALLLTTQCFAWHLNCFPNTRFHLNWNKTGARLYTRAVLTIFAEIHSTHLISAYIFLLSPTLGLPPRFIDALFGVHITGLSGWNLWCLTHYNTWLTWVWLRSLQSTLRRIINPSKFKLDKK